MIGMRPWPKGDRVETPIAKQRRGKRSLVLLKAGIVDEQAPEQEEDESAERTSPEYVLCRIFRTHGTLL